MKRKHVGCACQNKSINGMKRRKSIRGFSTKGLGSIFTGQILPIGVGYLAGNYLPGLVLKNNPQYGNYLALGLGAVLATQKGMLSGIGIGMATKGVVGVVGDLLDGQGVNLLPPGVPSLRISGTPDAPIVSEMETGKVVLQ